MIIFENSLVIHCLRYGMLSFLEIHIVDSWMTDVVTKGCNHCREYIHILKMIADGGLRNYQVSHVNDIKGMCEVVIRYSFHSTRNSCNKGLQFS